jgi:drug/metabolite transporter (DMT)-like permease
VEILLAGLSALMYGAGDFCGGLATRKTPVFTVVLFSQLVGLLVAVGAALVFRQDLPGPVDLLLGAAAGVMGTVGIAVLYHALATTLAAVASPSAAVTGAAIPLILGLALGERPRALALVGIALAVPAIILLTAGPAGRAEKGMARRAALLGAAAGMGFGLFFFTISRTAPGSGLWPLAAARLTTVTLVLLFAAGTRRTLRPAHDGFFIILLCGALDMGANIAFLLASRVGLLSVTAVVSSLYPGPTVLLAMLVFKERLTLPRVLGLALALAGVAFISA